MDQLKALRSFQLIALWNHLVGAIIVFYVFETVLSFLYNATKEMGTKDVSLCRHNTNSCLKFGVFFML